jgi:hypothetical protein
VLCIEANTSHKEILRSLERFSRNPRYGKITQEHDKTLGWIWLTEKDKSLRTVSDEADSVTEALRDFGFLNWLRNGEASSRSAASLAQESLPQPPKNNEDLQFRLESACRYYQLLLPRHRNPI